MPTVSLSFEWLISVSSVSRDNVSCASFEVLSHLCHLVGWRYYIIFVVFTVSNFLTRVIFAWINNRLPVMRGRTADDWVESPCGRLQEWKENGVCWRVLEDISRDRKFSIYRNVSSRWEEWRPSGERFDERLFAHNLQIWYRLDAAQRTASTWRRLFAKLLLD